MSFPALFPKKMRKYANNSDNMLAIQLFCLSLHPKVVRKIGLEDFCLEYIDELDRSGF
jgi:hypothetical protein